MAKRNVAANSSFERTSLASLDQKLALAKRCSHEGVMAGAKAAVVVTSQKYTSCIYNKDVIIRNMIKQSRVILRITAILRKVRKLQQG
ncbi:hypothetical protein VIGAN_01437600 [Vigna angularis var. angularis]|uniref:Uncharacterized protein n=1 Tax=Vigna angularis var. angularis TaxID=157739 RepID=A0A0S3R771_PHAAN|nr:hypothetical protein VIGAN_01437600 [Vigna angularis var. angularis]